MKKYLAIVQPNSPVGQGDEVTEVRWFASTKEAEDFLKGFIQGNRSCPSYRYTIAECLFTIED